MSAKGSNRNEQVEKAASCILEAPKLHSSTKKVEMWSILFQEFWHVGNISQSYDYIGILIVIILYFVLHPIFPISQLIVASF